MLFLLGLNMIAHLNSKDSIVAVIDNPLAAGLNRIAIVTKITIITSFCVYTTLEVQ